MLKRLFVAGPFVLALGALTAAQARTRPDPAQCAATAAGQALRRSSGRRVALGDCPTARGPHPATAADEKF